MAHRFLGSKARDMSLHPVSTRKARESDLDAIKAIADSEKAAFGFITRATIRAAIAQGGMMVVTVDSDVVGFQHYYHRKRDLQTTLYHKAVMLKWRGQGLGTMLVDAVVEEARSLGRQSLRLKCPADLPSNGFHANYGFKLVGQERGKRRALNLWEFSL